MPHQTGKNTLKIDANPKGGSMQLEGWNALPAAGCNTATVCILVGYRQKVS